MTDNRGEESLGWVLFLIFAPLMWVVIGGGLGFFALREQTSHIEGDRPQFPLDILVFLVMVPGAGAALGAVGNQIGNEMRKGKIGPATYWPAMIGLSAVVYPLLSSSAVGEIISGVSGG
ncbi:hypothetical protein [Streptomyces globisporus]|uniref:hypothetical protein n=1 Tax=Streptomyces globisporus TaxID=1908 RepID=UPI00345F9A6A|nr:hypothetical protein OG425_35095 [Streptomyces globisporus]